ncbi:MAG: HAD family hydrolase [Candidatus Limnocylindrales bacterium]
MGTSRETRGVVFDLDGVLVLSEHLWDEAWQRYAARHQRVWTAEDTRRCQGMSVAEWSTYLAERSSGDADDATRAVISEVVASYRAGRVALAPGARALVEATASRVPIALASSSPREIIDTVMGSLGLGDHFSATVSSAEVARGKPSPDVYLEAVRRLGVEAAGSIAVEDSSNGIRAAAAAGLLVIALPSPEYPIALDAVTLAQSVQASLAGVESEIGRLLGPSGNGGPHA